VSIRTIIVDDELHGRLAIKQLLEDYCPEVSVVALANSVNSGIEAIQEHQPDLVFLDISMPSGQGFEILDHFDSKQFKTIFVTAHADHAIRAFEYAAIHYLLKPINIDHLVDSVKRFKELENLDSTKLDVYKKEFNEENTNHIFLKTLKGSTLFELDRITHFKSDGKYSFLYLKNGEKIFVNRSLGAIEELLSERAFYRIHRTTIVNIDLLKSVRKKPNEVILACGSVVEISTRKFSTFYDLVKNRVLG
jgi:two-component system LytT family response regulator